MDIKTDQYDPSLNDNERLIFGTKDIRLEEELLGLDEDDANEFDYRISDDILEIEDVVYRNYSGSRSGPHERQFVSVLKNYFPYIGGVSYYRVSATRYRRETRRNQGTEIESTDVEFIGFKDLPSAIKKKLVG